MTEYREVPTEISHVLSLENDTVGPETRVWFGAYRAQCQTLMKGEEVIAIFGVGYDRDLCKGTAVMITCKDIVKHGMALFRAANRMMPTLDKLGDVWAYVDWNDKRARSFAFAFGFEVERLIMRRNPHGEA